MKFKLNRDEVDARYGGNVGIDGTFVQAAMDAAVVKLGEEVEGWHTYDVDKREVVYPLAQYWLSLDNENGNTVHTAYVEINVENEAVEIEVE